MEAGRDNMGAACVLPNEGKMREGVVLVGGREREPGFSNRAECFDASNSKWVPMKRLFYSR